MLYEVITDDPFDADATWEVRETYPATVFTTAVPETKWDLIQKTNLTQAEINRQYESRAITDIERYNKA